MENLTKVKIVWGRKGLLKTTLEGVISSTESESEIKIRTFPFSSYSAYDSVAYDPVKTRLSGSEVEAEG